MSPKHKKPRPSERCKIAGDVPCSLNTVNACYEGRRVLPALHAAIDAKARLFGLPVPPPPLEPPERTALKHARA